MSALLASPETVAAFLAAETGNGVGPSAIARRIEAIRYAHKLAGVPTPTDSIAVKATLRDIQRTVDADKVRKALAVAATVRPMVAIMRSVGSPSAASQWQCLCGFYPKSEPGELGRSDRTSLRGQASHRRDKLGTI